jgi:hypothetical protein
VVVRNCGAGDVNLRVDVLVLVPELRHFRVEAAELLGLLDSPR